MAEGQMGNTVKCPQIRDGAKERAAIVLRHSFNRLIGGIQSQKANRREYNAHNLVLANHWDGSVQQFYHFLLGYFMPLSLWLDKNDETRIAVRDCGPMNTWFQAMTSSPDIEIVPPGSALHAVIGDRTKHTILRGMDDPNKFDQSRLLAGAQSVKRRLSVLNQARPTETRMLIVDRASSEDFYHGPESETHMSGRERRHVPNILEIAKLSAFQSQADVVDFARMAPQEQIEKSMNADTLVGQHGAGLVHMLWMPQGSNIIEIAPPLPPQVQEIFAKLAHTLGHRYSRIPQDGVHAPIDINELGRLIDQDL